MYEVTANLRKHWDRRAREDIPLGVGASTSTDRYNRTQGIYASATVACLTRHLNLNELKNMTIMEFGCGSGRISKLLAPYVRKILCVDISSYFISLAQKNMSEFNNIEFLLLDSPPQFPFTADEIDFTLSYAALDYMPTKEIFFKTITQLDTISKSFALQLGLNPRIENPRHCGITGTLDSNDELGFVPSADELLVYTSKDHYLIEELAPEFKYRGGFDRFFYKIQKDYSTLNSVFGQQHLQAAYIKDGVICKSTNNEDKLTKSCFRLPKVIKRFYFFIKIKIKKLKIFTF